MNQKTPRLRIFAGPNGSGKTTVKQELPPGLFGIYVNPDEIEASLRMVGRLNLANYSVNTTTETVQQYVIDSPFLKLVGLNDVGQKIEVSNFQLFIPTSNVNSYIASVIADFIRRKLLESRQSFTFETVMSSKDKVELLKQAHELGYRTYLYFVATEDPEINISRVKLRVHQGGHDVPREKIIERYQRSLKLVREAIRQANRAYFFDTSGTESLFVAEITDGNQIELKCHEMPRWFKSAVWDQF